MSRLTPIQGALMNLRQQIPRDQGRLYLTAEEAAELLKRLTGKDFGLDADKWEQWVAQNGEKHHSNKD